MVSRLAAALAGLLMAASLALWAVPLAAAAESPAQGVGRLAEQVDLAVARLDADDLAGARTAYDAFDQGWFDVEDGVKAASRASYQSIERAMSEAKVSLRRQPTDRARARAALLALRAECDAFVASQSAPADGSVAVAVPEAPAPGPSDAGQATTMAGAVAHLDRADARLDAGDLPGASSELAAFQRDWPEVESAVKASSPRAYTETENEMARVAAALASRPADVAGARAGLASLRTNLAPFVGGVTHYGVFDAAVILLREGLEVLLVVAALLAFLRKTGHASKSGWIWAGSGAGLLASVGVAVLVNLLFAQAAVGRGREVLEGLTGLLAAGMLVYMSYWLHAKSRLGAWQAYIRAGSSAALARNSLFSLALIAFLAVFREGAETVLFYVGIAPSIALPDLALGLAIGAGGLAALGVVMLVFGLRIPVRPFFLATSVLVYYLAFKFVGTGLHALQVAGVLSATPAAWLPESGLLGVFPTWETTAAQAALLLGAVAVVVVPRALAAPRRGLRAA